MQALKYDRAAEHAVTRLIAAWQLPLPQSRPAARRLLAALGEPLTHTLLAMHRACGKTTAEAEALIRAVITAGDCYRLADLAVTGKTLAAAGIPAGRGMGLILQTLLDEVIAGTLPNEPKALLARAEEMKECVE